LIVLGGIGLLIPQAASADDRIAVAVSYFDNTSKDAKLDPLKKGLAEMLITDLSISKDLKMVERERLNDVLKEVELQKSPFMDQSSAAKLGKGLGAAYIVTGSYIVAGDTMRVDCRMIDVETAEIAIAAKAEGATNDFLSIERSLATQLLEGLGGSLSLIQKKKIGAGGTGNVSALASYSDGLDALDSGDAAKAAKALKKALAADPDFKAAQALKGRVDELAKAYDLTLYDKQVDRAIQFIAGNKCECAYAKPLSEIGSASYGTRMGYRMFEQKQVKGMASGGLGAWGLSLRAALDLADLGQFAQAENLAKALSSEDAIATGMHNHYKKLGVKTITENLDAHKQIQGCISLQVRSYIHLQQLELEEAMALQTEAAALPDGQFKPMCLSGIQMGAFGLNLKAPLKEQIQEAIDSPEAFAKRKAKLEIKKQISGKVWAKVDAALQSPPPCEELCPWTKE
jgi:TolB-like protein